MIEQAKPNDPTRGAGNHPKNGPASVTEVLAFVAPASLKEKLEPGPGFDLRRQMASLEWELRSARRKGEDTWEFIYESQAELRALCTVRLDGEYSVAVHRVKLTNTSGLALRAITDVLPLLLRLKDLTSPRLLSPSGAGSSSGLFPHTRECPAGAYRTSWIMPKYPRPVEFASGGMWTRNTGSSTKDLPIFMLSDGAGEGEAGLFFGLEWSSSWEGRVSFDGSPDRLQVSVGPAVKKLVLAPGESLELPCAHIGFFSGGFASGGNACRRYIHGRLTPRYMGSETLPPVAYTLWPGIASPYTDKDLYPQVDAAAEAGVEMFCLDADWYAGGYPGGVGNWEVDQEKFPNGLEPFAKHVRAKGMGLGLYFDSGASPGSRLAREHPEFFYALPDGYSPLKLNFGLPEACEYWIEMIGEFVHRYGLRYIRADFGIDPVSLNGRSHAGMTSDVYAFADVKRFSWDLVDPDGKAQFAHVQGLHRVWETLIESHPELVLELNDGGGNMLDLGSLKRHYCAWSNDVTAGPHVCHMMQLGGNVFVPANYMGLAIGPDRDGKGEGLDAGFTDLSFLSRMAGQLLLHGALATWSAEVRDRARHWIEVYKGIRHLLVRDYYRLLPQPQSDADWDAAQFSDGPREGVVFVFRQEGTIEKQLLFLHGLDAGGDYRFSDESSGELIAISGAELLTEGFTVRLKSNSARLYSYRLV